MKAGNAGRWHTSRLPRLSSGEVHVWLASLNPPEGELRNLAATLDAVEHERAARHRFARDRRHYLAARGLLRTLLGAYLDIAPASIRFAAGAHGKPRLESARQAFLHFNISHSGTRALFAFARDLELGVDIEYMPPLAEGDALRRTAFSARERAALSALDEDGQHEAFYACWARKEAYLKATGRGLSFPLTSFDVEVAPDRPARLIAVRGDAGDAARWHYYALPPVARYATALAVESTSANVRCWRWTFDALRPQRGD